MTKYTPTIKLKNTPLKEIVFGTSFGRPLIDSEIEIFKTALNRKGEYVETESSSDFKNNENITSVARNEYDGFIFKNNKTDKIINLRRGRISFHKIDGYFPFEDLLEEFKEISALVSNSTDFNFTNISLRYLNFLEINENEKLEDVLTLHLQSDFGIEAEIRKSFRLTFENCNDENIFASLSINEFIQNDSREKGIVLDIQTMKYYNFKSVSSIDEIWMSLREIKNNLFFKAITEQTIQKYR